MTRKKIVDRLGEKELLYLGPDENITPELIEDPRPDRIDELAGINHKEYGVTSEGVAVFLEVGLKFDPRQHRSPTMATSVATSFR